MGRRRESEQGPEMGPEREPERELEPESELLTDNRIKVALSFTPAEKLWLDREVELVGIPLATLLKSIIVQHYHLPQRRERRSKELNQREMIPDIDWAVVHPSWLPTLQKGKTRDTD